jgi:hypothetical protein
VSIALGQTGGSGGNGGAVAVTNSGQITTGSSSEARLVSQQYGIFAQSVGGGGGMGTMTGSLLFGSSQRPNDVHGIAMTLGGTASVTQSSTGTLAIDISPSSNTADRLVVAGTAQLAGFVQPNLLSTTPTSGSVTIVSATGGVSSGTQSSLSVNGGTAVITYGLTYPNASDIVLNYSINYANPRILAAANSNQQSMARSIQQVASGGALDSSLGGLINLPTVANYLTALDTLSPQIFSDHQVAAVFSGMEFSDALLSCAARGGAYHFVRQDECAWFRLGGWGMQRQASSASRGFNFSSFQIAGGGQFDVGDSWLIGAGGSVEFQNLSVQTPASSQGTFGQFGLVAKRTFGDTLISGSVAGGYGQFNAQRSLFNGLTASGVFSQWTFAAQTRAAHAFEFGNGYIKPRVDLGLYYLGTGSLVEGGAGGAGLTIQSTAQTYFYVQPALEIGGDVMLGNTLIRPNLTFGLTQFLGNASPAVTAAFNSAPGVQSFTVQSTFDTTYLDVAADLDIFVLGDSVVSLQGFGRFSSTTTGYGGALKLAIKF